MVVRSTRPSRELPCRAASGMAVHLMYEALLPCAAADGGGGAGTERSDQCARGRVLSGKNEWRGVEGDVGVIDARASRVTAATAMLRWTLSRLDLADAASSNVAAEREQPDGGVGGLQPT
jgi:hypothetical protein